MHTIRLRGPWEYQVLSDLARGDALSDENLSSGRVKTPLDWRATHGAKVQGQIRYVRNFNCPTGLTDSTVVRLCVGPSEQLAEIKLNGQAIANRPTENGIAVREWLTPANRLEITVQLPVDFELLLENVRLEIDD